MSENYFLLKINKSSTVLKRNSKIFEDDFYPIELNNNEMKEERLNYIHQPNKSQNCMLTLSR